MIPIYIYNAIYSVYISALPTWSTSLLYQKAFQKFGVDGVLMLDGLKIRDGVKIGKYMDDGKVYNIYYEFK